MTSAEQERPLNNCPSQTYATARHPEAYPRGISQALRFRSAAGAANRRHRPNDGGGRRPFGGLVMLIALLTTVATAAAQAPQTVQSRATLSQSAIRAGDNAVLAIVVDIAPGYHAQSNTPSKPEYIPFEVTLQPNDALVIGKPIFPPGHEINPPALGVLNVFDGRVVIHVPIRAKQDAALGPTRIVAALSYQVCDDNVCYQPETPEVSVETSIVAPTAAVELQEPSLFAGFDPSVFATLTDATGQPAVGARGKEETLFGLTLGENAYLLAFGGAFVVGIIFNVVPCVLPVLPLKAIGFYEAAQHSRTRCLLLGVAFSIGIIITFAALAVLVLVLHVVDWGELFSKWWFVIPLTVLLLVMAVGQFGFFGVRVPTFLYNVTYKNDTLPGNLVHGMLTALLSTPCTFGMFFALLIWAAAQPAAVGVVLLMTVGLGMAFPYLILSAFPQLAQRFPRTGPWPDVVKQMMAFLLLATAVYFCRPLLPDAIRGPAIWWVIWGLVALAGVFLIIRAVQISPRPMAIGIATAIALALSVPTFAVARKLANPPIEWVKFTDEAFDAARNSGNIVLVKFTADWCGNCQTVEFNVFGDEDTVAWLRARRVVPIKADLTKQHFPGWPLLRKLNPVAAIPVTAVYRPGETSPRLLIGIYSSDELKAAIQ